MSEQAVTVRRAGGGFTVACLLAAHSGSERWVEGGSGGEISWEPKQV